MNFLNYKMGKLLILARYVFLIYATDIYERRRHIHVTHNFRGHKKACKFWLEPDVKPDTSKRGDFSGKELIEVEKLIFKHLPLLLEQLTKFYNGENVKAVRDESNR